MISSVPPPFFYFYFFEIIDTKEIITIKLINIQAYSLSKLEFTDVSLSFVQQQQRKVIINKLNTQRDKEFRLLTEGKFSLKTSKRPV